MKKICNDNHLYRSFGKRYPEGIHVGKDYGTFLFDKVFAPANLKIIDILFANGYGSLNPSTKGYVIFADGLIDGKEYNFNFGHIIPKIKRGDMLKEGELLGLVADFKNGGESLPHLHFGVHDGWGIPSPPWGYVSDMSKINGWVDPVILELG